jgi:hypothetical protein
MKEQVNRRAEELRNEFGDVLNDISQEEKIYHMRQLLIDLMDYTEQSDDEKLWVELNEKIKEMYPDCVNYHTKYEI